MLYKFKSKAAGDVIMTEPIGDMVLQAMGRDPAAQGILEASALTALIAALQQSISEDEALPGERGTENSETDGPRVQRLRLKQRAWPLLEMMRQALEAKADIVWGV